MSFLRILHVWLLASAFLLGINAAQAREPYGTYASVERISLRDLPADARRTLTLIEQGGPFPYRRDGVVFQNREHRLPTRERGYYHEYTVPTPDAHDRGARRIISGDTHEYYYSADHYRSFQRIVQP